MPTENNFYLDMLNFYYPVMPIVTTSNSIDEDSDSDGCSIKTDNCSLKTDGCSVKTNHSDTLCNVNNTRWHVSMSHVVEGLELELNDDEVRQDHEEDARAVRGDNEEEEEEDTRRQSPTTTAQVCERDIEENRKENDLCGSGTAAAGSVRYSSAAAAATPALEPIIEGKTVTNGIGNYDSSDVKHSMESAGSRPQQREERRVGSIIKKNRKEKVTSTTPKSTTLKTRNQKMPKTKEVETTPVVVKKDRITKEARDSKQKEVTSLSTNDIISTSHQGSCSGVGRIVGLRLPSDVPPDFDEKNKPSFHRRVNPTDFLTLMEEGMTTTTATTAMTTNTAMNAEQHGFNDWKWRTGKNNVADLTKHTTTATTTALLDIYLPMNCASRSSSPGTKKPKKKIIRMIRNPNESVSATMRRLNMSVQKKLGGRSSTTEIRGGSKAKSKASKHTKCRTQPMLLKRRDMHERSRSRVDRTSENSTVQSTTASYEVNEAVACTTLWDRFYDGLFPTTNNACNPWNDGDDDSLYDSLSGGSRSRSDVAIDTDIIEGYDRAEYDHSLTINEVLHRAAAIKTDLDGYVLSLPHDSSSGKNNHHRNKQEWMHFILDSCPPTITSVATFGNFEESHLFERTPIVVEVQALFATQVQIAWFVNDELVCANSSWYVPTASDVGKLVTVVLVPKRHDHSGKGREEAYQFVRCVEALPSLPIISPLREKFAPRRQDEKDGPLLRIVTYNILADQNASRDVDKDDAADRSYSHCKNEHIVKWRRFPLIVHELLEYEPDIIALQEVDTDVYVKLLWPVLSTQGYEGYFSQKGVDENSGVREGCAIFWSLNVFESVRPVDMQTHTFRELIRQFIGEDRVHKSQWKSLSDVSDLLGKHDNLRHVLFDKLGHVLQTVVLTRRMNHEKVVVGNTHLFYHPMASHIRCLKMLMACRQLEIEHRENQQCPIILCGDLNSHPKSGLMKLLLNRYLDARNGMTWKHLCTYEWEVGSTSGASDGPHRHHDVKAIDLEFPSSFPRLMSAYPTPPDFTHFVETFAGTLDYILMTKNFEVVKSGPTPTREDMQKFVAMPNECMPSDHVSLVCDVKWR
jgi:mRNA deadenylase 3'-5' endonuclease subunit Ccr4